MPSTMNKPKQIMLSKLNLITQWELKLDSRTCELCRSSLDTHPAQVLQTKTNGQVFVENKIVVGKCGHKFHKSCVDSYMKTGLNVCPTDQQPWTTDRYLESGMHIGVVKKTNISENKQDEVKQDLKVEPKPIKDNLLIGKKNKAKNFKE